MQNLVETGIYEQNNTHAHLEYKNMMSDVFQNIKLPVITKVSGQRGDE